MNCLNSQISTYKFSFQKMVQKHFNIGVNIGFILVGTLVLYGLNYKFRLFYLATPKPDVTAFTCEHGLAYCTDNKGCYEKAGRCDGVFDCRDHSDEYNCKGHIHVIAESMSNFFSLT